MDDKRRRTNFPLRMSKEIDQRLTIAANKLGISKNAFIITVLAKALDDNQDSTTDPLDAVG